MVSPHFSVQMRCSVFNVCVRNYILSTHTSKSNSMFGTFTDKCPVHNLLGVFWTLTSYRTTFRYRRSSVGKNTIEVLLLVDGVTGAG